MKLRIMLVWLLIGLPLATLVGWNLGADLLTESSDVSNVVGFVLLVLTLAHVVVCPVYTYREWKGIK